MASIWMKRTAAALVAFAVVVVTQLASAKIDASDVQSDYDACVAIFKASGTDQLVNDLSAPSANLITILGWGTGAMDGSVMKLTLK